jgi:hypothetical protein
MEDEEAQRKDDERIPPQVKQKYPRAHRQVQPDRSTLDRNEDDSRLRVVPDLVERRFFLLLVELAVDCVRTRSVL